MLDLAITWLPIIGAVLVGYGATVWFGNGNKTAAIWVCFIGAVMLAGGLALHVQKLVWESGAKPVEPTLTEKNQLRAYVSVIDGVVEHTVGMPPTVALVLRNTGQTEARDVSWVAKFVLAPEWGDVSLDKTIPSAKINLPPQGTLSYKYTFETWDPAWEPLLKSGAVAIVAVGEIDYTDIYDRHLLESYRFISGGSYGRSSGIAPGRFGVPPPKPKSQ
jgi:hypothetical protein